MALNPQDLPSDKLARELARIYREAQRDLADFVERAIMAGKVDDARRKKQQLVKVQAFLEGIGRRADPIAREAVAKALADGGRLAQEDLRSINQPASVAADATFNTVNREATIAAQDALLGHLEGARVTVLRSVNDVFARQTREATVRATLGADGSAAKASRRMARQLEAQGQTSFVDTAGRRWKLADYTDMAVRTATRQAVVDGQINRLTSHGISLVRISTHGSSCDVCAQYENRLVDLSGSVTEFHGEPVASGPLPPFHPRCVAPGTEVSGRGLYAGFRTLYRGDLVNLTTASAVTLSVTPNHPVMTRAGWLLAGELREGDEVLRASDSRGLAVDEQDFHNVPALIEDVFEAFAATGARTSVAATGDDFHGDARYFESKVDVVFADRSLLNELAAASAEEFGERELVGPGVSERLGVGDGAGLELLVGATAAASSCVCGVRRLRPDSDAVASQILPHGALGDVRVDGQDVQSLSGEVAGGVLLDVGDGRLSGRTGEHLLGASADMHAEVLQLGANAGRARAELASAVRQGDARGVEFDQLVRVNRSFYSGHVYDLSALDGSYCANTLIVSNCAHTVMAVSERVEAIRRGDR